MIEENFQVETNLDDQNPELLPYFIELLLNKGANDAWVTPIIMKKGRPGFLLSFLCFEDKLLALINLIAQESRTIGLRYYPVKRKIYPRKVISLTSPWGPLKAKLVEINGLKKVYPEYEECKQMALKNKLILQDLMNWVLSLNTKEDFLNNIED